MDQTKRDLAIEEKVFKKLSRAVKIAKNVIKAKNEQFSEGSGRYDLVLDSEAELFNYERSLIASKYELFRKKIRILWRQGHYDLGFLEKEIGKN